MPRDTLVSWKTLALFVLFPPLVLVALVLFPLTLLVVCWLDYRGKYEAARERLPRPPTADTDCCPSVPEVADPGSANTGTRLQQSV